MKNIYKSCDEVYPLFGNFVSVKLFICLYFIAYFEWILLNY